MRINRQPFSIKNINPVIFFIAPWLFCFLLLTLDITEFTSDIDIIEAVLFSSAGLIPAVFLYWLLSFIYPIKKNTHVIYVDTDVVTYTLRPFYYLFLSILTFEFIYFGYIPIISMLRGADVTHFDFGLPGIHGFLYALGSALATIEGGLFIIARRYASLINISFLLACFILLVTRKIVLTIFIQFFILYVYINGLKGLFRLFLLSFALILIFGLIGDIRTGRDLFLSLSALKIDYPDWLPSGFIWFYIYLITPLLNYVQMVKLTNSDFIVLDLFSWLIPPRVLAIFTGENDKSAFNFENEWQISGAFNIASGFSSIYPTLGGHMGVVFFSLIIGFLLYKIRQPKSFSELMLAIVINGCALLMVFNNNFLSLNNIFQIVIFWFFSIRLKKNILKLQ